jgi:hypothetical protein
MRFLARFSRYALVSVSLLAGAAGGFGGVAPTDARAEDVAASIAEAGPRATVVDLTPRFLNFYEAAQGLEPESRFALWRERYGFAAVPPTPQGQERARRLLDEAFDRYPQAMDRIRAGAAGMALDPQAALDEVAALLGADRAFEVEVIAFVGGFERSAFTFRGRVPAVAIPVEQDADFQNLVGRHELVHAVHIEIAGLSGAWERSVAQLILQEGLAMRATQAMMPQIPDQEHISSRGDWFEQAMAKRVDILAHARPVLEAADSATVARMAIGPGPAGLRREAYLAGWILVGRLLEEGWSFPQLARVPAEDMPQLLRGAIDRELADS